MRRVVRVGRRFSRWRPGWREGPGRRTGSATQTALWGDHRSLLMLTGMDSYWLQVNFQLHRVSAGGPWSSLQCEARTGSGPEVEEGERTRPSPLAALAPALWAPLS